jgi:hypothetical protein
MEKPWMPLVAGILDIVSGAFGLVVGLFMTFARHATRAAGGAGAGPVPGATAHFPGFGMFPQMHGLFSPAMGIALIIISVLAIVGGIFALRIKTWGLALAGSIAAVISGRLLGVLALIFTVLGKKDFK